MYITYVQFIIKIVTRLFFVHVIFFLKIYVYKLVYYQVSTYVNRFFLSFWTYVHELVFNNSMFINSTYIPLCFFFF